MMLQLIQSLFITKRWFLNIVFCNVVLTATSISFKSSLYYSNLYVVIFVAVAQLVVRQPSRQQIVGSSPTGA